MTKGSSFSYPVGVDSTSYSYLTETTDKKATISIGIPIQITSEPYFLQYEVVRNLYGCLKHDIL